MDRAINASSGVNERTRDDVKKQQQPTGEKDATDSQSGETRLNRQNSVPGMSSRRERVNRVRTIKRELATVSCEFTRSFATSCHPIWVASATEQGRHFPDLILISARKHAAVSGN